MNKITIGIIGNGFCGSATSLFVCDKIDIIIYDKEPNKCFPHGTTFNDLLKCNVIFICINTPLTENNEYYLKSIDKIIDDLHLMNYYNIVVRSTVTPEYCSSNQVSFFPEFLTEQNWKLDFYNCQAWIVGLDNNNSQIKNIMENIINIAFKYKCIKYNNIIFTTNTNAELCKLIRNSYLATKVSFFNEIYQICNSMGINYNDEIRNLVVLDNRIGETHTLVPNNYKYGFGGSCFPKDTLALCNYAKKINSNPIILENVIYRNENIDRPAKEWRNDSRSFKNK